MRKALRIVVKTILWIIGTLIFIIVLLIILIQVPAFQDFIRKKAVVYLEKKIHTKVEIGHISLIIPTSLKIDGVYLEDQRRDTLLYSQSLLVNMDMWKLFKKELVVQRIDWQGVTSHIVKGKDSLYNFDYIIKAFGSTDTTAVDTSTGSSFKIALDKINLDRISVNYLDSTTGNYMYAYLGHFDTRIKQFDLDKMAFDIPKISFSNINARIEQTQQTQPASSVADTATSPLNLKLKMNQIDVSRIHLDYHSPEMTVGLNLNQLLLAIKNIDIPAQDIQLQNIELNHTTASVVLNKPTDVQKAVVATAKHIDTLVSVNQSMPWKLSVENINLAQNHIRFDNESMKPVPKGLDYGHMDIRDLGLSIQQLDYAGDSLQAKISSLKFRDKSGFAVDSLHTIFFYGPTHAYLKELFLQLPNTLIRKNIAISYPSLDAVSQHIDQLGITADLEKSKLGMQDVLLIAPFLSEYPSLRNFANATLEINAKLEGRVGDLHIPSLDIRGLGQTNLKASGRIQGLPDPKKTYMDLVLADFNTTRSDIVRLAPPGTLPEQVSIPESMHADGNFKGSMDAFVTNARLKTSDGTAALKAMVNMRVKDQETYEADVSTRQLNLGRLMKQPDQLGQLSMQMHIKGTSFNPKKASLALKGVVQEVGIKGYNYHDLTLDAQADQGKYQAVAAMADPNIHFSLDGQADMSAKAPAVRARFIVDSVDFQALHLTQDSLRFHGQITADIPTADPDSLNGRIEANQLLLVSGSRRLTVDTLLVMATADADSSTLALSAADLGLQASMAGKYKLTQLAPAFQNLINHYFNMDSMPSFTAGSQLGADSVHLTKMAIKESPKKQIVTAPSAPKDSLNNQQLHFNASFYSTPKLKLFVPDLHQMDTLRLDGQFNSGEQQLKLAGSLPELIYGTDTIQQAKVDVHTERQELSYRLDVGHISVGSAIQLYYPSVYGMMANNQLTANLLVKDPAGKPYYRVGADASIKQQQYQMRLNPDSLLLDYQPWQVSRDNFIQYDSTGVLVHHFSISDAGQELSVNSEPQRSGAPINVNFKDFKIETLTKIMNQDSIQVGGTLKGAAQLDSLMTSPVFTAALQVKDLNFRTDTLGDIALNVDNKAPGSYHVGMELTGQGNQMALDGAYYTDSISHFDFDLNLGALQMKSLQGFTMGYLKDMSGSIDGKLKISGTTTQPLIDGKLHFNKAAFNVAMLNAPFVLPNENISFDQQGIRFDKVVIQDRGKNKATIDGRIKTTDYLKYGFGLTLNARNFQVINSTRVDNPLYYGKLFIDTRMNINGDMDQPSIDGTIGVNAKTDLTIVLPTTDPSIEDRQGVVEFVNKHQKPNLDSIMLAAQLDSLRSTNVQGIDLSATIDVDKNALFSVLIDERSGDMIKLRGEAHLNGGIDLSGKINLTGTYEVNDGSYNLSYATVKRKFDFKKGSTITWTGDPTSANVNLTAIYVANVPPIDLVESQLASTTNIVQYKQKLPFNVALMMKNQLLKPDISFDITLPDDNSAVNVSSEVTNNVNTRLSQIRTDPNEMNKQVLGVLVLGHFIGDNPLESMGGGLSVEGAIRNSVSSLLSDQLNKLADNLITGVDLDFGLTSGEDYSSGTATNRTDLNVGISKSFLDDRLTVTVGNNFNLEGGQAGEKATNIAGNVSANYKLSRDGRYMVRAYRKDHFIVIQGQVIETGIGFSMTLDYNKFKEILRRKSAQQKQWLRNYKARQKAEKKAQAAEQTEDANPAPGQTDAEPEKSINNDRSGAVDMH